MDKASAPPLLPIFRSRQQAEILALVLGNEEHDFTLPAIVERTGAPYPSVHREIERAHAAGLISVRRVGNSKVVRADTTSPYYSGLSDVLVKAFGPPQVLLEELSEIEGIDEAFIFGSWAARHAGEAGRRPVGDIDLLVLGDPDRDAVYLAASRADRRLGREVQVTFRADGWLRSGTGSFHDTVVSRPMFRILPGTVTRTDLAASNRKA